MRAFALLCVVVVSGACTPALWSAADLAEDCESPVSTRAHRTTEPAEANPERPVIVTMRTRDHDVIVHAGDGLRFTIADPDGTTIADGIDRRAFEASFPALHQHFETAFATERTPAPTWAGM